MIKEILDVRTGKRESIGGSGSNQLKLVARGTYLSSSDDEILFSFNTILEENKMYIYKIYVEDCGTTFGYIMLDTAVRNSYFNGETDDLCSVSTNMYVNNNKTEILFRENGVSLKQVEEISYTLEVYELPFTLGGAE